MKTSIIILFIACTALFSCNEINPSPSIDSESMGRFLKVEQIMMNHQWYISFFWNAGEEQTHMFSRYRFEFQRNNRVKASNGINTVTGIWYINSNANGPSVIVKFNEDNIFGDLTHEWDFVSGSYDGETPVQLEEWHRDKRDSYFLHFSPV